MRSTHLLLLASLLGLVAAGCRDEAPSANAGEQAPDGSIVIERDGGPPVVVPGSFLVLIVHPDEIEGEILTTEVIYAHVFSSRGVRVPQIPVRFELISENPGRASLSVEEVMTDDSGCAEVELYLGTEPAELDLQVTAYGVEEPLIVPVRVKPRPTGRLRLNLEGVGPARIGPIDIFVMSGTNRCPYNPVVIPFGELAKARAGGVEEVVDFDGQRFPAGEPLTIWARGMCGNVTMRTIAAAGCLDGVMITANETTEVTLTMVVRPLNMVGTFDAIGHYDFTDAIPGTAGDVIRRLDDLFNNTARFLIDGMQDLLEAFVGGIYAAAINWVINQIQPLIEDAINQWILDVAPDWLLDFFQIGRDLLQIANDLEILSVMRFDKTGSDFSVAGTEEWIGIALYWRLNCGLDDPPDCGRNEFNMEELLRAERPIEAVFATFNARTNNFNQLRMAPHDVNLQYGRLILFVLNELILPAVADGAHSLSEALINVLDCEGIGWRICGDDGEWGGTYLGVHIGFDVDDVIGWCEGAAEFLGDSASNILDDLAFDSVLTIEGDCDLYEDDFDLMVDRLEDGHYRGWFNVDGIQGNEFQGEFRGDRRPGSR